MMLGLYELFQRYLKILMLMNDKQIVEALIAHDKQVTQQFFFKDCRPLFVSIIRRVFSYSVDYDEFVNELYLHLMENDGYRLRQYQGRSSIYQWLKITAIRYFIAKRDRLIDMSSKDALLGRAMQSQSVDNSTEVSKMDIERLLTFMTNKRYVYVIRQLVLKDAEPEQVAQQIGVSVDNLYNIKRRAIAALTKMALKEAEI
ncbi:MAG: sigma-70 family RNA polymerase sigma factor [Rikenellaceae bacterium]|nr:sigma-70 family RNA polymerase sigma factor [Rikenellaceae bacterium]